MTERKDGGPAFPVIPPQDEHGIGSASGYPYPDSGMSLRDYFAGQMLVGFGAAFANMVADDGATVYEMPDSAAGMAVIAYTFADAMIAERAK